MLWEWFKLVIDPVNWSWSTFNSEWCDSKFASRSIQDIGFTPTMWCAYLCLWCEFPQARFAFVGGLAFAAGADWRLAGIFLFSLSVLFPMFDKEKMWIGGEGYQMLDEDGCAWRLWSLANFIDHGTVEETLNHNIYICTSAVKYIYMINKRKAWSAIQRSEVAQEALQQFRNNSVSHDSPHPKFCSWIEFWTASWIDMKCVLWTLLLTYWAIPSWYFGHSDRMACLYTTAWHTSQWGLSFVWLAAVKGTPGLFPFFWGSSVSYYTPEQVSLTLWADFLFVRTFHGHTATQIKIRACVGSCKRHQVDRLWDMHWRDTFHKL